jgi:hypothetical protein
VAVTVEFARHRKRDGDRDMLDIPPVLLRQLSARIASRTSRLPPLVSTAGLHPEQA